MRARPRHAQARARRRRSRRRPRAPGAPSGGLAGPASPGAYSAARGRIASPHGAARARPRQPRRLERRGGRATPPGPRRNWARAEPEWGIWDVPEAEVGALPDVAGRDVVELGCGTAYFSAWLARRGARPIGVDVVREPARHRTPACRPSTASTFPLIHASAEAVPLPDACADLVLSEYGASLWCEPEAWIAEAARLLRPGGDLVFLTNHLLVALTAPDAGACGDRLVRDQRGLRTLTYPDDDGDRVPPRARRVDRAAAPARPHGDRAARALRAGGRRADALRLGHAGVGAALARRGDLDRAH